MQDLTSTLFKPYTLVIIRLDNGETIQGTVFIAEDGGVQIQQSDGVIITVDKDLLSRAEYCYTGFPTVQERVMPLEVKPNGRISSYSNGSGFMETASGKKYNYFTYTLADPELSEQAKEGGIVGENVLFLSGTIGVSSIIKAGPLDSVLDTISAIARGGKVKLAKEFCDLILQQYPDVEDVIRFEMILEEAIEKAKGINYYAPIPAAKGFLKPSGRIYSFVDNGGFIVDVASHKKLFFHDQQLFGGLYEKSNDELIGQPVVYSVKKEGKENYQARTVIPPMRFNEAYEIAKELKRTHYQQLTAFDLLRIINKQTKDLEYQQALSDWGNNYIVQERIWHFEKLADYTGEEMSLYLASKKVEKLEPPMLERSREHSHVVTNLSKTPEPPSILSPNEMEELLATMSVPVPEPKQEPEKENVRQVDGMEEIVPETIDVELDEDTSPSADSIPPHTVLPSLEDCPDGEQMIPANAFLTVVWGDGSIYTKGSDQEYVFSTEDIIDKELKDRAGVLTIIKDEPIVCQLYNHEFRAAYICSPMTVLKMLSAAEEAILTAESIVSSKDWDKVCELYDKARGYVLNVLKSFSTNSVALLLLDITEEALKRFGEQCYVSPFNGIVPCGSVSATKAGSPSVYVSDTRFIDTLFMSRDEIVDRDYTEIRVGDELVYSLYPKGKNGVHVRFVCLARPISELIAMAERWEEEESYEKAWGIAMSVLDAQPDNPDAHDIVRRCESYVGKETKQNRQRVICDNKYAQGVTALRNEKYEVAADSFISILESRGRDKDLKKQMRLKCLSVHRLMETYQEWWLATGRDTNIHKEYRRKGEKYLLGKEGASYCISYNTLDDCDLLIGFYKDMEDYAHLVEAYRNKLTLFNNRGNKNREDKRESKRIYAELYAQIAWNLLIIGDTDAAAQNLEYAINNELDLLPKNNREKNPLIPVCEAILYLRNGGEKKVRNEAKFAILDGVPIDSRFADKVYSGSGPIQNFTVERYALLSAIVNLRWSSQASQQLLYYVGRYLATLTCDQEEYKLYIKSTKWIPADCNFVLQVNKCLERKATWRSWRDVRLLCMLSKEVAYNICASLYVMNSNLATSLLVYYDIEVRSNPDNHNKLKNFAESFAVWRGANYQDQYQALIKKYDQLSAKFSFDDCLEFLNDLEYRLWMIPDDMELVNEIHWELPGQISEFKAAANSRAIRMGSKDIIKNISKWSSSMIERPTVLMMSSLQPILLLIANEVKRIDEQYKSCEPNPECTLLTTSALADDNSMYIEVKVHNKETNAESMSDCKLHLLPSEEISPDKIRPVSCYPLSDRVFGDESLLFILHFSLKAGIKLTGLKAHVRFDYRVKTEERHAHFFIPFKPLSPKSYKRIINDYNFGSVEVEHFYGREATIENAVHSLSKKGETPHYFIYGQKRSGKSSVMIQIMEQMKAKNTNNPCYPSSIIVDLDFSQLTIHREEDLYLYMLYSILKEVKRTVKRINKRLSLIPEKTLCKLSDAVIEEPGENDNISFIQFLERLEDLNDEMRDNEFLGDCKIILFIDEFTSAYIWLKDVKITKDFMFRWKVMQKRRLFAAILIGQDILRDFVRKCNSPNPFEVLEKERLNYLSPDEARRLVVDRITEAIQKEESEIFVGNALGRILEYSASSAYYTKWICQRLVNLLNLRRLNQITEVDVDDAVWDLLGDASEAEDKFDALFLPGLEENVSLFPKEQVQHVMDVVADEQMANPISGCQRSSLLTLGNVTEEIIQDLLDRDVIIDPRNNGYYFVKVKLYVIWRKIRTTRIS